jgi:hypothetical protein
MFTERSNAWAIAQGLFLTGALLTHYTTIVVLGALGPRSLAIPFMLIFIAGFAALLAGRTKAPSLMALLVVAPFAVGLMAAAFRVFPFAGSRHQTYLLPFLAAGISAALAWLPRGRAVFLLLLGAVASPFWVIHTAPENDARVMPIGEMTAGLDYVGRVVPPGAPLFVDDMTRDVLKYYLTRNDRTLDTLRFEELGDQRFGGYLVVVPTSPSLAFRPAEVVEEVRQSARAGGCHQWILCGWSRPPGRNHRSLPGFQMEGIRTSRNSNVSL